MEIRPMSEETRTEWLATYHQGDQRLQDKRHGILRLNRKKQRIEFAVQTMKSEKSPLIIVNYPIKYLKNVEIIEKREKLRKNEYIQLTLGESPEEMTPLFSLSIADLELVKSEILKFNEEIKQIQETPTKVKSEEDIIEAFARLLTTPIEQFQQLIGEVASRLKILTIPPKAATKAILSSLEQPVIREIQEVELNNRKIKYYETSQARDTVLVLLSPIGGQIEDFYPVLESLRGSFKVVIYGLRGYTHPIDQDFEFKLNNYIEDVKYFLEYIGNGKKIVLGAQSVFSAIILEEFLDEKYSNIEKLVLISGLHRAPNNFRKGVKALPHYRTWGPFKGHVRKIAPKILFSKNSDKEMVSSFIKKAFTMPDKVYYQIFKDFLPKYDYTSKIQSVSKPILLIWGTEDQLIPSGLKSEMVNNFPPNLLSHKEIVGGHMIHLDAPSLVAREIDKFMFNNRSTIHIE